MDSEPRVQANIDALDIELRVEMAWHQTRRQSLADAAELHVNSVSRYINGKRDIP